MKAMTNMKEKKSKDMGVGTDLSIPNQTTRREVEISPWK